MNLVSVGVDHVSLFIKNLNPPPIRSQRANKRAAATLTRKTDHDGFLSRYLRAAVSSCIALASSIGYSGVLNRLMAAV